MDSPTELIFECGNPKCGVSSCRHCRDKSHPLLSCERASLLSPQLMLENRHQTANKLSARHAVEEAMTAALVRVCNNCKVPFLKGEGCNHMRCEHCGNEQCFVCSINVIGYSHFGNRPGMCPQEDNTEERLRAEVASAQDRAVRENLDKQGEWTVAEIMVDATLAGEAAWVQQERARREREEQEAIARQRLVARMVAEGLAREQNRMIAQRTAKRRAAKAARKRRRKEEQEEREREERKRERNRRRRARARERKQREAQENQPKRNRKRRRARNQ
jgi:hypothetical protein